LLLHRPVFELSHHLGLRFGFRLRQLLGHGDHALAGAIEQCQHLHLGFSIRLFGLITDPVQGFLYNTKRNAMNSEEIRSLEMMTSRKLRQARYLAENAARGVFPSIKKPAHMVDFDPEEFQQVIAAQLKWRKAENKKFAARSSKS
jgi:hypothetical protein